MKHITPSKWKTEREARRRQDRQEAYDLAVVSMFGVCAVGYFLLSALAYVWRNIN